VAFVASTNEEAPQTPSEARSSNWFRLLRIRSCLDQYCSDRVTIAVVTTKRMDIVGIVVRRSEPSGDSYRSFHALPAPRAAALGEALRIVVEQLIAARIFGAQVRYTELALLRTRRLEIAARIRGGQQVELVFRDLAQDGSASYEYPARLSLQDLLTLSYVLRMPLTRYASSRREMARPAREQQRAPEEQQSGDIEAESTGGAEKVGGTEEEGAQQRSGEEVAPELDEFSAAKEALEFLT